MIGEYSVLEKGSAFVVATEPCFEFATGKTNDSVKPFSPHPESPAGKAFQRLFGDGKSRDISFLDPHRGRGGFGGSTAEWLAVQLSLSDERDPWALWFQYQEDARLEGRVPSGADVLAQILGGVVTVDFSENSYQTLKWPFPDGHFLIFRTGLKLNTHAHLQAMKVLPKNDLEMVSQQFGKHFKERNFDGGARSINDFAVELLRLGLVDQRVQTITQKLRPHAAAVKGCGAMGVDTVVCFVTAEQRKTALDTAAALGLEFVADETMLARGALP